MKHTVNLSYQDFDFLQLPRLKLFLKQKFQVLSAKLFEMTITFLLIKTKMKNLLLCCLILLAFSTFITYCEGKLISNLALLVNASLFKAFAQSRLFNFKILHLRMSKFSS